MITIKKKYLGIFLTLFFWGLIAWLYMAPPKFMLGQPISLIAAGLLAVGIGFLNVFILGVLSELAKKHTWIRNLISPPGRFFVILIVSLLIAVPYFLSPLAPSQCAYKSVVISVANAQGQNCTSTCTNWQSASCGGWSSCYNKNISCNNGRDQNGRPCQGCCFSCKIVCQPTDQPPTISGNVTCNQTGQNGWCRSNAQLALTASDPQGYALTITGNAGSAPISCNGSCTVNLPAGSGVATYTVTAATSNMTSSGSISWAYDPNPPTASLSVNGTSGSNGWYISSVVVSASGADAISGLAGASLSVDGGPSQSSAALGNGVHTVNVNAVDNAGNTGTYSRMFSVDTTPPALTSSVSGTAGLSGWYVSGVTVTATDSDADSGIASTSYRVDGGGWLAGTSATVSSDGGHTVDFIAFDKAGNQATTSQSFKSDPTPPTISLIPTGTPGKGGWYVSSASLAMFFADSTSGVASAEYNPDGAGWTASPASIPLTDGKHTVLARAMDYAGNQATASVTVNVDTTSPTQTLILSGTGGSNNWYTSNVQASINASDATSGVASGSISDNGGAAQPFPITLTEGIHNLQYASVDAAGNTASATETLKIDTTAPSTIISSPAPGSVVIGVINISGQSADAASGLSSAQISFDGANWLSLPVSSNWTFPWDTTSLPNGAQTIYARSIDRAGNIGAPVQVGVILDNHPPYLSVPGSWSIQQSGALSVEPNVIPLKNVRIVIKDPFALYPDKVIFDNLPAPQQITWDRIIGVRTVASPGLYPVQVEACDIYGVCAESVSIINVSDAPAPTAMPSPTAAPSLIAAPPLVIAPTQSALPSPTLVPAVTPLPKTVEVARAADVPVWPTRVTGALLLMFALLLLSDPRPAAWRGLAKTIRSSIKE